MKYIIILVTLILFSFSLSKPQEKKKFKSQKVKPDVVMSHDRIQALTVEDKDQYN